MTDRLALTSVTDGDALERIGQEVAAAAARLAALRTRQRALIRSAVTDGGMSESEAARRTSVDRMTVRRALGKR